MKSQFCPCLLFLASTPGVLFSACCFCLDTWSPAQSYRVFAPQRGGERGRWYCLLACTIRIRSSLRRLAERRKPWRFQVGKAFAVFVLGGRRPQLRLFRDSREGGRP
ncbi:hypothetical protein RchiOBHm_Chr1g0315631 [Rosa chinensis]|uniref:Secreted protein n=1 Tax=Rosa chinensis TaxID=74649 RepID=A0A2P6S7J7_ROSCH|nr:hypothetical protein RchiOBHm_Chr1g0315631 [Rosa chinensis]